MSKDPKKVVQELVRLVGKPRAERLLIEADVSPSTAGKLVRGTYASEVGLLIASAIEKAKEAAKAS
jgi:hypothetical protein